MIPLRESLLLIATLTATAIAVGAYELLVTRLASVFFFTGITHLILGICLMGFSLGALTAKRGWPIKLVYPLMAATVVFMPVCWSLVSHGQIAWLLCTFAIPFATFGCGSTLVWRHLADSQTRTALYLGEMCGAVAGLVLLGPYLLGFTTVNSLGGPGFNNHLRNLVQKEGLTHHQQLVNASATTDIVRTRRSDTVYFFTDARFVTRSVQWDGTSRNFDSAHTQALAKLKRLALASASKDKVLLLGAGAGFDIAVALQEGAGTIDAVEVNGNTIDYADTLDAWAGDVFGRDNVSVHVAEARRFVKRRQETWDQVNLTLLQTAPSTGRGTTHVDGRVLTLQALATYLQKLSDEGTISIIQNDPLLAAKTLANAWPIVGSREQVLHYELSPEQHDTNPFNQLILIRHEPFPPDLVKKLDELAGHYGAVRKPLRPAGEPTTDDRPFLFQSFFSSTLHLTSSALMAALVLAMLFYRERRNPVRLKLMLAAAIVGGVVMSIQAVAIYKSQTALGDPVLALTTALATTISGAGIGALLLRNFWRDLTWRTAGWLALASCLVFALTGDFITNLALSQPVNSATATVAIFLFACSIPLGLPFLAVMYSGTQSGADNERIILGCDGIGAVLGGALAGLIAMSAGINLLAWSIAALMVMYILIDRLLPS